MEQHHLVYDELQQQRSSVEGSTILSADMLLCCSADACPLKIDTKENTWTDKSQQMNKITR